MAAHRRIYDSRHLQADCKEPGSAPETSTGTADYFLPKTNPDSEIFVSTPLVQLLDGDSLVCFGHFHILLGNRVWSTFTFIQ